ncbi:MAG: extracellular solute-binding protein, partial [Hyphomicrobiales bacterium]|nr:extracellular solute-binding protein [Hyphomicrobiales bacterium]
SAVATASQLLGTRSIALAGELSGPVNWLAWSTFADPDVMAAFEKATGIKVNLISFGENAEAFAKLQQAGAKAGELYDVVQSDAYWPRIYYEKGLIEPLDLSSFSSAASLFPQFREFEPWKTEQGLLAYPNTFTPFGVLYSKERYTISPDSWEAIFDPAVSGRIAWFDAGDYMLPAAALSLGIKEPSTMSDADLQRVVDKLKKAKQHVKVMAATGAEMITAFTTGEVDVAMSPTWAFVYRAWHKSGIELGFIVPKEGTVGTIDGDSLVKGAAHAEAAKLWINFQHKPENMLKLALRTGYAGADKSAVELLKKNGKDGEKIAEINKVDTIDEWLPKMALLRPPADPSIWVEAWNEVKGA